MMQFSLGAATDVGRVRSLNEDSLLVDESIAAVADGMGGHRSGEVASHDALDVFRSSLSERTVEGLLTSVRAANTAVYRRARDNSEHSGMGTTLCAVAMLDDQHVGVVNVGDSRVYLYCDAALTQISEDHSFVEGLVRDGRLTRAQADVHPQRNVLTRALGIEPELLVDGWSIAVTTGDRFLLCSDGLFNEVSDPEISAVLGSNESPQTAAEELVRLALEGGGRDNVTVIVVDITTDEPDPRPLAERVHRKFSGEFDETVVGGIATVGAAEAVSASATATKPKRQRRPFNWRVAAFALAILAIIGVAIGSVYWYARNTFVVGERSGQVVIFEGRPNGVLWVDPVVRGQDIKVSEIPDESKRRAVEAGVELKSLSEAQAFVDNLTPPTTTTTTTSTTTTSTTTTTTTTIAPETTLAPVAVPAVLPVP